MYMNNINKQNTKDAKDENEMHDMICQVMESQMEMDPWNAQNHDQGQILNP